MFRLAALLALAPLVISADLPPAVERIRPIEAQPGVDGYVFQQKAFTRLSMFIQVHEYGSRAEMHAAFKALFPTLNPSPYLAGFSTWDAMGCHLHVIDPAVSYQPGIIGHELSHCLHGDFHPGQDMAR
jgi:hypothetical protein